ncbi:MAG: phosphopantetheine-binding protein [Acidobacteriota bacterium]|nr:phosphopantetheine-binding protein [Acidobacteriota bacterium]
MTESTFEHICTILKEQDGVTEELTPETVLSEVGLDSLAVVEAVMACEADFDIEIDTEANPQTIGEFVELVDGLLEEKQA